VIDSETKKTNPNRNPIEKPQDSDSACGFFASGENIRFRPMTMADIDEIMVIERSAYRIPWSQGFFLQELQVTCARSILAELNGKIIGYILYWLLPDMIDIHNVAIHVDYRRRGIARLLLAQVLAQAGAQLISRVTLEVRKSNLPAQRLYESFGFVATGLRKGYYSDNGEDALAMTLEVAPKG
jgi:ribosomal-protein-alanine N-acetyltransferase